MNDLHELELNEIGIDFIIRHSTNIQRAKIKEKHTIWNFVNQKVSEGLSVRRACIILSEKHIRHLSQRSISFIYYSVKDVEGKL